MSSQHIRLASAVGTEPITFTNFFQDPIVLPPHSRVALKQTKYNPADWHSTNELIDDGSYLTWELTGIPLGKTACRSVYAGTGNTAGQDDNNALALATILITDVTNTAEVVEESNPLNFIPLNNKYPITLNALGITIRDETGSIVAYEETSAEAAECQYVYLVFDVECPKFSMRDLANLLQPKEDIVVAEQTEITKDILGK